MTFANPPRIARNSSTLVEGKKNAIFEHFLNRLRMHDLHFQIPVLDKKKAHFQVKNGQILHDFIANYPWIIAKLNVLCWQTLPVMFANTPCNVGKFNLQSRLSRRFLIKTAPFHVHFKNSKKKQKRAVYLLFILQAPVQEV